MDDVQFTVQVEACQVSFLDYCRLRGISYNLIHNLCFVTCQQLQLTNCTWASGEPRQDAWKRLVATNQKHAFGEGKSFKIKGGGHLHVGDAAAPHSGNINIFNFVHWGERFLLASGRRENKLDTKVGWGGTKKFQLL